MNLFRSEEHVRRWLDQNGYEAGAGATITAAKLCELAHAWSADRLAPDWQPRSRAESQAILDRLGLTGPFWRLAD
jgi:hypothetical protein